VQVALHGLTMVVYVGLLHVAKQGWIPKHLSRLIIIHTLVACVLEVHGSYLIEYWVGFGFIEPGFGFMMLSEMVGDFGFNTWNCKIKNRLTLCFCYTYIMGPFPATEQFSRILMTPVQNMATSSCLDYL